MKHMETARGATATPAPLQRAWYGALIAQFVEGAPNAICGDLLENSDFAVLISQRDAWFAEITILQGCLRGLQGSVYLEFNIPRMGRRADAVLVIRTRGIRAGV